MKKYDDDELTIKEKFLRFLQLIISIVVIALAASYNLVAGSIAFITLFSITLYHCVFTPSNKRPKISFDLETEKLLDKDLIDSLEKSKSIVKENTHMNQNKIVSVKEKDEAIKPTYELTDEEFLIDESISTKKGPTLTKRK